MTWLINNWQWLAVFIVSIIGVYFTYKSIKKTDPTEITAEHNIEARDSAKVAVVKAEDNSRVSVKQ
jgi:putative Mn2+ efflux pump MntP